jgi:ribonuclease BN (tRNA processing enzyme)
MAGNGVLADGFRGHALVTHLHFDHVLGLPFFTPVNRPGARLEVFGPHQRDGSLGEAFHALVRPPYFPIHLRELRGDITFQELSADTFALGALKVTSRVIPHVGTTLGYRIEADGKSLCYVSDHQAPADRQSVAEAVLELCDGADLLIHDAQYTDAEYAEHVGWGHSSLSQALSFGSMTTVGRLLLFHHDPLHSDEDLDAHQAQAHELWQGDGTPPELAFEGMELRISPS